MFSYVWPIAMVVFSNIFYQICAKSVPEKMNPFASLVVTYFVGMVVSAVLFFFLSRGTSLVKEIGKVNWAPLVLGLVIVGLEVGTIYAYKAGWPMSILLIVHSSIVAIALIFVGFALYREVITWNKVAGILLCLAGLVFINFR